MIFPNHHEMTSSGTTSQTANTPSKESNWLPDNFATISATLKQLAENPSVKRPVAIFDFDNTCIFRDIGQALFRFQIEHLRYKISPEQLAAILPPEKGNLAGRPMAAVRANLLETYSRLYPLIQTGEIDAAQQTADYPLFATLLLWSTAQARKNEHLGPRFVLPFMAKMLAGFTSNEVRQLAVEVVNQARQEPLTHKTLAVEAPAPIGTISASYPLGLHAYPEMQALMTQLQACGIERYVISASTEWLVEGAAPHLGFPVESDHIYGIRVQRDSEDRLTTAPFPEYPVTFREGKAEIIQGHIDGTPVLVAGDADTDYEMLTLPQIPLRILINRCQSGLIGSLYREQGVLLQGIDLAEGCFLPSRESVCS
nr:haloacid dehalogenase-like hydrolase [uncultured Desulfobulbus sp.]